MNFLIENEKKKRLKIISCILAQTSAEEKLYPKFQNTYDWHDSSNILTV